MGVECNSEFEAWRTVKMRNRISVIVLAAGKGSRMHSEKKKQFIELDHKPVLYYCLERFEKSRIDEVILVTAEEDKEFCRKQIVEKYGIKKVTAYVNGGKERFESVKNGLEKVTGDVCMIHDGARPFPPREAIDMLCAMSEKNSAVILGVPVKDTIKVVDDNGRILQTPKRSSLMAAQTPQMFKTSLLRDAYAKMERSGCKDVTDDAMIVERFTNTAVSVIMGSYTNLKITTPEDLQIAENQCKTNCL
ncbi:2-C-methyl-D-erythritol 4-phosphate cytidylyltransferase [Lachnospiraceae bacterium XBB1006]|nr:2-C-methyl-D-erythritol 4-phosphate cytidylyltransferase [Lachnospiraceae bacterium XBB1006]